MECAKSQVVCTGLQVSLTNTFILAQRDTHPISGTQLGNNKFVLLLARDRFLWKQ